MTEELRKLGLAKLPQWAQKHIRDLEQDLESANSRLANEWVSVKDKLPAVSNDVLVINELGDMEIATIYSESDGTITWVWWDELSNRAAAAYWLPIPAAPKS